MAEREKSKPTYSLESWFNSGLVIENIGEVSGSRPVPAGYRGCTKDFILLEASACGVFVFPVRADVGEVGADNLPPLTLYHYTHKHSFDKFVHLFGYAFQYKSASELQKAFYEQLQADYQERVPAPSPQNMKGEPLLTSTEPAKFKSMDDILVYMYGKIPSGFSSSGNSLKSFAEYCIAVRVPASACFPLTGVPNMFRFCKETLEHLKHRLDSMRETQKEKLSKKSCKKGRGTGQKGTEDNAEQASASGCLSRFCGISGRGKKAEYWDQVEGKKSQAALSTKFRQVDQWKKRMAKRWVKEHLQEREQSREIELRRVQEEARLAKEKEAKAQAKAKPEFKRGIRLDTSDNSKAGASQKTFPMSSFFMRIMQRRDQDGPRDSTSHKEVVGASKVFGLFGAASHAHKHDVELETGKAAAVEVKLRRAGTQTLDKKPIGTKRAESKAKPKRTESEDCDERVQGKNTGQGFMGTRASRGSNAGAGVVSSLGQFAASRMGRGPSVSSVPSAAEADKPTAT